MKLAFSTNAYLHHSVLGVFGVVVEIGYAGIEIMADVPHAWPAYLLEEQKQAIRDALSENKLAISNTNTTPNTPNTDPRQKYWHPSWIEPDANYRRIRIEHTKKSLTLAKELGAPSVTTEPGGPVPAGMSKSAALSLFVEMLKPVVEHAEKVGVPLLIEPEPELLLETVDDYLEFVGMLQSPMLGLNFDIGHFYCVGNDPADAVRRLAAHIRHVHLEDIAATRVHNHLVPGEGAIDLAGTLRALRDNGYGDWVTIELYTCHADPDTAARISRDRVLKQARDAGVELT